MMVRFYLWILNKRMYKDVWDAIYIFSQSVDHDGTWNEVKKYVRESLNKDPSKHFFSECDGEAIKKTPLRDKDKIQIGRSNFRYVVTEN